MIQGNFLVWINKSFSSCKQILPRIDGYALLLNDAIKVISKTGNVIRTYEKTIDGREVVEISTDSFDLYFRNDRGNVYTEKDGEFLLENTNVIKMNGKSFIKFDGTYAYSETSHTIVPIMNGNKLNVYDNGVTQNVDGTFSNSIEKNTKVLKTEGSFYLTPSGVLKSTSLSDFSISGVVDFGALNYDREAFGIRYFYDSFSSTDKKLDDYVNANKEETEQGNVTTGKITGVYFDEKITKYILKNSKNNSRFNYSNAIWYSKGSEIKFIDNSGNSIDINYKGISGDEIDYNYLYTNDCKKDFFISNNVSSIVGFDKSLIMGKEGADYEKQ